MTTGSTPTTGFSTETNHITYTATSLQWAMLVRAMRALDSDQIEDDLERVCFELWREAIQVVVEAAFAKAWLNAHQLTGVSEDVRDHLRI